MSGPGLESMLGLGPSLCWNQDMGTMSGRTRLGRGIEDKVGVRGEIGIEIAVGVKVGI